MASIEAQIAIILKGTSELNKLQSKLDAIQATADQISQQAFDIQLGRVSDVTTYAKALKTVNAALEKTDASLKAQSTATQQSNAEIKKAIRLESQLRRERSLVSRFTREFTIETKGLDQSAGQLKDIKDRFNNLKKALDKAFELQDVGIIKTLKNELSSLVQEQRDWNRTLTGTKKTGVNADFLKEQARGYKEQIDALRARARALGQNEDIINKLGSAERNLVTGRSNEGTFLGFADPRLGRAQLANATKLIQQQEAQRKAASSSAKENERLSSAAVALDKQRQSALEKIFQVEEKIRSSKRISAKEAQDYYFQAQLPRTALPFGDVNQPAMRGGARRGGIAREMLGGARTADEAEATFRLIEEKSKKTAKAVKQSFADVYKAALPPDALSGLTALEKVGKALASMKGGGLNERASQLQRILQIEEKIRSSRRISAKEAQEYYSRTQLPRLALPLGDVNQPAIRGGARQGGSAREFLGGGRSAEEAETTFRLIEEKARKTGKTIKQSFADAYKAMLPPDTLLTGLAALGKVGKTLASMKVGGGGQSGLQGAIESLREARGARESFFGGASPAEAIDQIVREFNTGKPAVTEAAGNITQSFSSGLRKGAASSAAAAKAFATAAAQAINDAFGIKSPSRFMIELVRNLVSTYIAEMQKSYPRINAATQRAFGQETLLRDVKKLTATNKGFEFASRASTGFRPLAMGAGTEGASGEFQEMMNTFRKQIAGLTTQPEIYQNLLKALPDSRITTDLVGAANRRALVSEELPSFMPTQRMLGPGELEKTIAKAAADYFRTVRTPDPWVGLVGDYKRNFVDKIIALTQGVKAQLALPPARETRIAGALPPALFESGLSPAQELRRQAAYRRSEERSAAIMGQGTTRGLSLPSAIPGGPQLALPPAAQRGLQDAISDLFGRISNAVRGAFGGPGGPRPPAGALPGGAGGGGQGGQAQQAADLLGLDALGDISRISTRELETLSATFSELRAILDPTIQGFDRLDNQLRETIGNIGRQIERRAPDANLLTRNLGPRAGRAVSEGLIGGAFPLLFGQGAGASVGGLAGGVAGGFAGGGLGFGLSLIGTALGTAFDTAVQSATELGAALSDTSLSFDKVKEKALFSSKETEKLATKLTEAGFAASASILAQQEIINKVGASGYKSLIDLANSSDELGRAWSEFNLQLQAALAGPMAGLLEWVASILALENQSARSQQFVKDVSSGLGGGVKEEFDREARIIDGRERQGSTIFGTLLGGLSKEDATKQRNELAQLYAEFAIPVKVEPKLTDKQKIEQELALLGKNLEAISIGKSLKDAVRQSAREQQDLDKQRADLVRSYEESIGNIRKQVEDEVSRRRFSILEKENQLLDLQAENRIKQLEAANAQTVALAGRGERGEVAGVAQEVAQIVADFTEQQLSAEEEAAKIKRDAALDARKLDFEAGQFKANIEKEVAKLNIETARKVADINEGIRRRNEETDSRRFNIERRIAQLQLGNIETELKLAARAPGLQPEIRRNTEIMANIVGNQIQDIEEMQPPAMLRGVGQAGGAGVSTTNFDAIVSKEKGAIQSLVDEVLRGIDLTAEKSRGALTLGLLNVTDGIDKSLKDVETREADIEVDRLRRIELVNAGLAEGAVQRVVELEQLKKIALAQYDAVIAQAEGKIIKDAATAAQLATNAALVENIKLIKERKDALEGKFGTFDATTSTGTGAIGSAAISGRGNEIQDFITKATSELNNLEQVAINVSQGIGNAVGNSLSSGISGLIEGTATAKEVFAGFLRDVGQLLVQEGTKMIAMYVAIAIAKAFAGMSGGGGGLGFGGDSDPLGVGGGFWKAANGATFSSGTAKFAKGDTFTNSIVSSPTLFKFADGGTTRTGLMGEAGPEAIMPLSRGSGGRLGVDANGLREAMSAGGGGTSAPMLNMTFETTSINGVEYVSRDQLEAAMSATRRQAAKDGAKQGMSMTLDRLQQSPKTRNLIGLR